MAIKLVLSAVCLTLIMGMYSRARAQVKPVVKKLGTIDCDMVETTPVVFLGRLYRFEYVRAQYYKPNTTGDSYFRFVDIETGDFTPGFAKGYHLGSPFVDGDTVYVYGVEDWGSSRMAVFWSKDMKDWDSKTALDLPGWEIFNNSVCKGEKGYVMAFEVGGPPEEAGVRFTSRFAVSPDLFQWELTPSDHVHTRERYSACPAIQYLAGYYYNIYLESLGGSYAPYIVRSKDLVQWEESPFNPIMRHSDEDRVIANAELTPEQRERVATAKNLNNSDVDFCEFQGKTVIYYSWGNQQGVEHLAEAVYEGDEASFLEGFFPETAESPDNGNN